MCNFRRFSLPFFWSSIMFYPNHELKVVAYSQGLKEQHRWHHQRFILKMFFQSFKIRIKIRSLLVSRGETYGRGRHCFVIFVQYLLQVKGSINILKINCSIGAVVRYNINIKL